MDLPPFILQLAGSVVRHAITVLCGTLITAGYMTTDQQGQLIQWGLGITGIVLTVAWSWVQKKNAMLAQLLAAASSADPAAKEQLAKWKPS